MSRRYGSRSFPLATAAILGMLLASLTPGQAAETRYGPGVTDTEIKIGQTMPYSGPLSGAGTVGRAELAYFEMLNEEGGINGRKVRLISLDDAFSPPKTVEQTRKLVEEEQVLAIFGTIGTAPSAAVQRYLNERKIPQLFIQSGASRLCRPRTFSMEPVDQRRLQAEARIYARYILANKPNARVGVLYQNDDYGKDYLAGLKAGLGERASALIVAAVSYEVSDATVDSQIVSLQAAGADVFVNFAALKFASQAIRKAFDIGWKPLHFVHYYAQSIPGVLAPAGLEKAVGVLGAAWSKGPGDPTWDGDPDMRAYLAFMKKYYAAGEPNDGANLNGYSWASALAHVLRACGDDLPRENLMRQAVHLKSVHLPHLLPGIALNTSPSDYTPVKQFVMQRFDGTRWVPFGAVVDE